MPEIIDPTKKDTNQTSNPIRLIRRSEDYVVNGLGKVTVLTALDQDKAKAAKEPTVLYSAYAILGAQIGNQVRPFPVEWLMENVNSLDEAFNVFEKQAIEQLKQNMEESRKRAEDEQKRIITAPAGAIPKMP